MSYNARCQSVEDLWKMYNKGQFAEVLEKAEPLLKEKPEDIDLRLLLGRTYTDVARYGEAIPNLNFADQNDAQKTWRKAWSEAYLGICYFSLGEPEKSKKYLDRCIQLNATENVVKFAAKRKALFGLDDLYRAFTTKESEQIIFHFHPAALDSIGNAEEYIQSQEKAYENSQAFFSGKLPKKEDCLGWNREATMQGEVQSGSGIERAE